MSKKIQVPEIDFAETLNLFFSDYETDSHERVTEDGVQTLRIKDAELYEAELSEQRQEMRQEAAERNAALDAYEQHQIDQQER